MSEGSRDTLQLPMPLRMRASWKPSVEPRLDRKSRPLHLRDHGIITFLTTISHISHLSNRQQTQVFHNPSIAACDTSCFTSSFVPVPPSVLCPLRGQKFQSRLKSSLEMVSGRHEVGAWETLSSRLLPTNREGVVTNRIGPIAGWIRSREQYSNSRYYYHSGMAVSCR